MMRRVEKILMSQKNRVYKVLKNGSEELVEKIPGVEIVFHGVNNTIKIHETFKANKLRLCVGDSCSLVIDEGANCTNSYIDINAKNINVKIGKNFTMRKYLLLVNRTSKFLLGRRLSSLLGL